MNRSIAFVITRMNWYRFFAPVIDKALARGWHVECWHDIGKLNPDRPEDFPDKNNAPHYSSGTPLVREFSDVGTIYRWIKERKVDAVVDVVPHTTGSREACSGSQGSSALICLSANTDWQAYLDNPSKINDVDIFALNTPYWFEQSLEMIRSRHLNWFNDSFRELISAKTAFVGWPQLDQLENICPNEVRREYGIPVNKPVVVYFNWIDWYLFDLRQRMFCSIGLKDKILTVLRNIDQFIAYLRYCFEPNLQQIMNTIRKFCDNNDAYLILKHRFRDKPFECELNAADLVISDENYYPHSIFKVLSVASLSMGFFSFAVRESVACKVPYISIDACGLADLKHWGEKEESFYRRWSENLGPFNYKGIVSVTKDRDFVRDFKDLSMSDFIFNERLFYEYREKYLADSKIPSSDFLLAAIDSYVDSRD